MITKEQLSRFISKVLKPGSEVVEIKKLGSGMHGTGFLIWVKTVEKEERYVLKTIMEGGFGHEYPSDRAKLVVDALLNYPSLPKGNKLMAAGSVQEDGSLKDLGNPKDFFMIVEEIQGEELWSELNRVRDKGKLDEKGRDTIIKLADYLAELHSIEPEDKVVPDRYKKFVRDYVGSGELTMGVIDTFPDIDTLSFVTKKDVTEIIQKQVEWWMKIKDKHHRLTTVHGDFHPGNVVFIGPEIVAMDRSRTRYGDVGQDIFCIIVNLINYSIMSYGEFKDPFKEMVELFLDRYLEKIGDYELLEVAPFFISFIAIVAIHPIFYSAEWMKKQGFNDEQIARADESKKLMVRFNKNVLSSSKFDYKNIGKYFEEQKEKSNNYVIWFTGLPGSGKSWAAKRVANYMKERGVDVEWLRMDQITKELKIKRKYNEEERDMFYRFTVGFAKKLSENKHVLLDATAHRKEWRDLARELIPNFVEVFIYCPIEEAIRRETKRKDNLVINEMYEKALKRLKQGKHFDKLGDVVGVDVPYEEPENPEVIIDTDMPKSDNDKLLALTLKQIPPILDPTIIDARIPELINIVKRITDDSSHGYLHAIKTMNRSIAIGAEEEADLKVLAPATLLHDIGLFFGGEGKKHSKISAEKAPKYLSEAGYSEEEQKPILHCIEAHNCRYEGVEPETKEAKILIEADTLEKLGSASIKRAYKYIEETGQTEKEFAENWVKTRGKLMRQDKVFYTKTGKKYGEKVLKETLDYWRKKT